MEIDELYTQFGFKILNSRNPNIRVYAYRDSYFHNAEIVHTEEVEERTLESVSVEYQKTGYACRIRKIKSIEEAEDLLFAGFFAVSSSKMRLSQDYDKFSARLSRSIGAPYQYITCNYSTDYDQNGAVPPLLETLTKILSEDGPCLVIIEAAAGYGKTCTAFESLKWILDKFTDKLPVITELSRNRQARHFRYVLLDQIDRDFPSLNYDLVKQYIHNGKIPVIVDGFDELLHRNKAIDDKFEDAEPMLETIGSLLSGNAKVILTTRRTAIFSGDEFSCWIDSQEGRFQAYRVTLEKPTLADWLGYDRRKALDEAGVPLQLISSPVLLSYLRNMSDGDFSCCCNSPEEIVEKYLSALLEREQERQDLQMSVSQQLTIFHSLAKDMVDEDFNSEAIDDLRLRFMVKHNQLLATIRESYPRDNRPTVEELCTKLVNHALLDKKNDSEDTIGFVNDFALGTLVGKNICDTNNLEWLGDQRFADAAVTAFIPREKNEKYILWQNIQSAIDLYDETFQLNSAYILCGYFSKSFSNCTFSDIDIENTLIGETETYTDVVFVNSKFLNVKFYQRGFIGVTFLNCQFFNCDIEEDLNELPSECQIYLINCKSSPELHLTDLKPTMENTEDSEAVFNREVLRRFWPQGRAHMIGRKALRTLYLGVGHEHRQEIANSIDRLRKMGILIISNTFAEINVDKVDIVRQILGRE